MDSKSFLSNFESLVKKYRIIYLAVRCVVKIECMDRSFGRILFTSFGNAFLRSFLFSLNSKGKKTSEILLLAQCPCERYRSRQNRHSFSGKFSSYKFKLFQNVFVSLWVSGPINHVDRWIYRVYSGYIFIIGFSASTRESCSAYRWNMCVRFVLGSSITRFIVVDASYVCDPIINIPVKKPIIAYFPSQRRLSESYAYKCALVSRLKWRKERWIMKIKT